MWVENLSNGKVRFADRYTDPMTGNLKKVSVVMDRNTARNRKQAQIILNEKMQHEPENNLTLSHLIDLYRKYQKMTVKPSTYSRNYYACKSLMNILGKDTLVDNLSARFVNQCLLGKGETPGTINERIERFKALMRWGYDNDYVKDISWLNKVRKQKDDGKAEKLEQKYLEGEELKALLDAMDIDKWRYLAQLTAYSGLRVGEAIALETKDVDLNHRIISVTKTFDPVNQEVSTPKTANSCREVYIQDELAEILQQIITHMKKERFHTGVKSPLLISDVDGNHLDYYAYNKYLGAVSQRILGRKITSHYMRHTHVALLAEQGIPLDVISRRLGHGDSKITRDVYFHVTEKLKERDNEKLKDVRLI